MDLLFLFCGIWILNVRTNLLRGDVDVTGVDGLNDSLGRLAINLAANTVGGSENLLDGTREVLGERLVSHGAGDLNDLVKGDRLVVLDVLLLLAITGRLLEGLDDQGGSSGDNRHSSLTVLDGELDSYAQAFPVTGSLGNVFSDLLGRETQRTNLGSKSRGGTDLTTSGAEVDHLNLIGVELGRHCAVVEVGRGSWFACQEPP
jgi:hypothetical protein